MEPHTDILNNDEQPELVILQMLQRDAEGGESTIIPVQRLERSLDDDIINILGAKVDLGRGPEPILWGRQGERCIRLPSEFKKRLETGTSNFSLNKPRHSGISRTQ